MTGNLKANLKEVQDSIEKEGSGRKVLLVAVSKKQPVKKIEELFRLGVQDFGENYLQEALEKQEQLQELAIRWHFIGTLQTKKIKDIVGRFHLIHTVARSTELEKIERVAKSIDCIQDVLIQVNIANEESKNGVRPNDLHELLERGSLLKQVRIRGLMFFPPASDSEESSLRWFGKAQQCFLAAQKKQAPEFDTLSMGTSGDFHLAVRQGATHVRVGERLLGPR